MTVEPATAGKVFLAYLEHVLCPQLQAGDLVVMGQFLSAYKVPSVRELILARGAKLLYLPPYSLDFNPMSNAGRSSSSSCAPSKPGPLRRWSKPWPSRCHHHSGECSCLVRPLRIGYTEVTEMP